MKQAPAYCTLFEVREDTTERLQRRLDRIADLVSRGPYTGMDWNALHVEEKAIRRELNRRNRESWAVDIEDLKTRSDENLAQALELAEDPERAAYVLGMVPNPKALQALAGMYRREIARRALLSTLDKFQEG